VKQIIAVSKERDCWSLEELKEIDITYHNVSEIISQLQGKDPVLPEPVLHGSMDEVD
jgi:recombinational DNA repair protein RecR